MRARRIATQPICSRGWRDELDGAGSASREVGARPECCCGSIANSELCIEVAAMCVVPHDDGSLLPARMNRPPLGCCQCMVPDSSHQGSHSSRIRTTNSRCSGHAYACRGHLAVLALEDESPQCAAAMAMVIRSTMSCGPAQQRRGRDGQQWCRRNRRKLPRRCDARGSDVPAAARTPHNPTMLCTTHTLTRYIAAHALTQVAMREHTMWIPPCWHRRLWGGEEEQAEQSKIAVGLRITLMGEEGCTAQASAVFHLGVGCVCVGLGVEMSASWQHSSARH